MKEKFDVLNQFGEFTGKIATRDECHKKGLWHRAVYAFIIDDKGIVRTIFVYPLNVGRFVPEIIRTVQALQMADCSKGSTAANWMLGQPVIVSAPKTFEELQERQNFIRENQNGISWYLSFKEPPEICEHSSDNDIENNNHP